MLWKVATVVAGYYYFVQKNHLLAYKWLAGAGVLLALSWAFPWKRVSEALLGMTIMSNKVTFDASQTSKAYASSITLHDPPSFEDAVLVYDPAEADFDSWVVRVTYGGRGGQRMSGLQRVKGLPFPQDPSKRMVQLFRPVTSLTGYVKPRQPTAASYVHRLEARFFYERGGGADQGRRLAMLDGLRRTARVMLKDKRGRYVEVARFGRQWGKLPSVHAS